VSHLVDRLELELHAAEEALARQLLDRLSRLHHRALEELLERVLDQLSPSGTLHRLERLELDLGEIPAGQLERDFPQRLEQALRRALPPELPTAVVRAPLQAAPQRGKAAPSGDASPREEDSPSGEASPSQAPDTPLSPHTPGRNTRDPAGPHPPSTGQPTQAPTANLPMAPSLEALPHQPVAPSREPLPPNRHEAPPPAAVPPIQAWLSPSAPPAETAPPHRPLPVDGKAVPPATAAPLGLPIPPTSAAQTHKPAAPEQPPRTTEPLPPPGALDEGALELLAFFATTGTLPWWAPRQAPRLIPAAFNAALRLPPQHWAPLLHQMATAPAARQRLLLAIDPAQRSLMPQPTAAEATSSRQATTSWRQASGEGPAISPAAQPGRPGESPTVEPAAPPAPHPATPPEPQKVPNVVSPSFPATAFVPQATLPLPPPNSPLPPNGPLQASDPAAAAPLLAPEEALADKPMPGRELLVDGAGLVLLWPFLETLFDRLAWLTPEQRFVGAAERQRAMALLAFLVDGEPSPPEWRLPLPKLLCGAPPGSLWGLDGGLSEAEQGEAEKVLQAALAHAEGRLGEDLAALREQWLHRPGLLSWRSPAWLLVVERRDDLDGALEQLPWSTGWIRLPWMPALVQVAW